MLIRPRKLPVFFPLLFLFCSLAASAQIRIASPYSRFGIGDLSDNNNAWTMSMGQTGLAFWSPYHVNYSNPASYTAFDSLSIVFEGGFNSEFVTLASDYQRVNRNYATLGYLLFGFPVTHWWKTSLGLVPFSDVGYNVVNYEEYPESGTVIRNYSGSGGINRLFWGNGFQLTKNFSIGFNGNYLFGSMLREAMVLFPDSVYAMNFKVDYYVTVNDLSFSTGLQYRGKLRKDLFLTIGGIFAPTFNLSAKTDLFAETFMINSSSGEVPKDTLGMAAGVKGKIVLPMTAGGGFAFEKPDHWMVGIDYRWQNWEKFRAFDMSDSLVNSWSVSAGAEIVPKIDNYNNYLARVRYRIGGSYNKTYLHLRGTDLSEYTISLGLGLPLRGMKTMLNIGAQFGSRGTIQHNLIRETYFKFTLGFSIYERWFIKRKYY